MQRVNIDVVCGEREACSYFSLNAQRDLLRHRTLIIILACEKHGSRWQGTRIRNGQAKLFQVCGCKTGELASRRRAATDDVVLQRICWIEALQIQRLENLRRTGKGVRRVAGRRAEDGDECIGDGAATIYIAEHGNDAGNLRVNRGIENAVPGANHRLMIVERIPGEGYAGAEVFLGRMQWPVL